MYHIKVVSDHQVVCSQGYLAIVDDFQREESSSNVIVKVTLLPPGIRLFSEVNIKGGNNCES